MKARVQVLVLLAASLWLAGCSKSPEPNPAAGAAEAPAAAGKENLAREKPDAGKIDYVTVSTTGEGATIPAAVNQAILLAVQQVNGQSVEAQSLQIEAGLKLAVDEQSVDIRSSAFADLIASSTQGRVSSFRILSQEKDDKSGLHKISIEAKIARFARPDSANRLSVAVAEFRTGSATYTIDKTDIASEDVARQVRQHLVNALTKSGRVSVLDREFEGETGAELQRFASGKVPQDDMARLGQQIATDYVLVGSIDRFEYARHERALRTSDRTLVSHSGGGTMLIRLINVTTGQIEQSETVAIDLPETEPTTLGSSVDVSGTLAKLTDGLSERATTTIIGHLFPVTVLSVDGDDVVLSQGGDLLSEGRQYEIVARGKELKDPQTGQSLGRVEKPCCVVQVTKVTAQMSYGTLVRKDIDVANAFAPGALEVRREVVAPASPGQAAVATASPAAKVSEKSAEKPAAPSRDSDW